MSPLQRRRSVLVPDRDAMTDYRIRRARPSELPALLAMDRQCFPYDSREDFKRTKAVWWVVVHQGELVGYAGGFPWNYGSENAFVLCRCGVLPGHRGHGLQRRLLAARIAHAKREGRSWLWTYTASTNMVSSNNLIRAGFTLWRPARWGGVNDPASAAGWLYWKRKVAK